MLHINLLEWHTVCLFFINSKIIHTFHKYAFVGYGHHSVRSVAIERRISNYSLKSSSISRFYFPAATFPFIQKYPFAHSTTTTTASNITGIAFCSRIIMHFSSFHSTHFKATFPIFILRYNPFHLFCIVLLHSINNLFMNWEWFS